MTRKVTPLRTGRKARRRRKNAAYWRQWSDSLGKPGFGQPRRRKRPSRLADAWRAFRSTLALAVIAFGIAMWQAPELVPMPDFLSAEPQWVEARWVRCRGQGRLPHCVVDGDTIRVGDQSVRLMGFDTPEAGSGARCPREARLAEDATAALEGWLNEGGFWMRGRLDDPTDRWGRQLRELYRGDISDREYVGNRLVAAGLARRYYGGSRESWC